MVANKIYPPIMAGGAELIVAWLSEGLTARGHRVTVVSTCGPDQALEHRNLAEQHTVDRMVESYLDRYRELLAKRSPNVRRDVRRMEMEHVA